MCRSDPDVVELHAEGRCDVQSVDGANELLLVDDR